MSFCPHAEKVIDYCSHDLNEKEREDFEKHLSSCDVCQRELRIQRTVEDELLQEFDPGFVESRVIERLKIWQAEDVRSFWLYAFRVAVSGIAAAIAGFVLIPMLIRLVSGVSPGLGQYVQEAGELLGQLAPGSVILVAAGFCYITVFAVSMYSLALMRR